MADPFVGEIRIFGFEFAPSGWALCNGQLLPLTQNVALFALIGATYGGDGKSTFALPDLQGAVPVHAGQGPGLSERFRGDQGGQETVTLLESEIPTHSHGILASPDPADLGAGGSDRSLARSQPSLYSTDSTGLQPMAPQALAVAGSDLPHNNLMPYLTLNFCIALQGVFPSFSP